VSLLEAERMRLGAHGAQAIAAVVLTSLLLLGKRGVLDPRLDRSATGFRPARRACNLCKILDSSVFGLYYQAPRSPDET
jgi:hypothetical protein